MTSLVLWAQHRVFASARGSSPSRDRVIDEETDGGSTQAHNQVKHIIRSVHWLVSDSGYFITKDATIFRAGPIQAQHVFPAINVSLLDYLFIKEQAYGKHPEDQKMVRLARPGCRHSL